MNAPKRILLFETSALLATLKLFTDPFTHAPDALERLVQPIKRGEGPLIDEIKIPDHVLYELTGLLPISFPTMLEKFKAAKDAGQEQALNEAIELYALASPRGEVHDPQGEQKNHIRVLLRFIANHPDSLIYTNISRAFCQRLKADFSVLSPNNAEALDQYRPTFSDVFEYLGDDFKADHLRVHIGQLLMMGLISEREYNKRLDQDEIHLGLKKRFLKTQDLLKIMHLRWERKESKNNGDVVKPPESRDAFGNSAPRKEKDGPSLSVSSYKRIKAAEKSRSRKNKNLDEQKGYLNIGAFERYPELLQSVLHYYRQLELKEDDHHVELKRALGPSHLQLEHYLYSGIIPRDNESLLAIASALHFDINGFKATSDRDKLKDYLHAQGFYELRPTRADLVTIRDALANGPHRAPLLERLITALPQAQKSMRRSFNEACRNPQAGGLANQSELRIPHIGLPYEKVFSDALVNGALSWEDFSRIVKEKDGLHEKYADEYRGTQSGDILLKPSANAEEARILVSQNGFVGRTGKTLVQGYISHAARTVLLDGREHHYIELSAAELITRCRASLNDSRYATKLYRVFETMLYRPVTHDAADVRMAAIAILGEDKVVQLEKDFANRHARKSQSVQPPYMSIFSAFHTNARIGRKNLGEVATAEAAMKLLEVNNTPDTQVFVANHDSDLFPFKHEDLPKHGPAREEFYKKLGYQVQAGDITLENAVVRQHGAWFPAVRHLNRQMSEQHEQLQLVGTSQLLASLDCALGRLPQKNYDPIVKAKTFILRHESHSWAQQVHDRIEHSIQRR